MATLEITITETEAKQLDKRLRANATATLDFLADARQMKESRGFRHLGYSTWAEYAKEGIGYTPQHLNRLLEWEGVTERISKSEHNVHSPNPRQADEIAKAPLEIQAEVWAEAVEEHGEKVTAAKVAEVVEKRKEAAKPTPKKGDAPRNKNGSERITAASRKAALAALGGLVRSLDQMGIVDRCRSMLASIESEIQDAV